MRTNIDIDDDLLAEAQRATGLSTKREVVHEGLRSIIRRSRQREALDALRGSVPDWGADLPEDDLLKVKMRERQRDRERAN
jgi:Arc/MetJ family transcription regulator